MDKQPTDIHGKSYNRNLLVLVLIIGSFCTVLNGTLLATALPSIMRFFHISTATAEWLSTAFLLVNGVMIPISAWLINRFGSRKMYLSAMSVFFIGTVIAAIAPNFGTLLAGRIIQGLGVGVTMPLLQTIMLSIFPANKRGAAMGTVGIVIGLAPAIGPTLSGWIVDNLSWRYLFSIIAPIAGVVIVLAFFLIKDVLPTKKEKIDILSVTTSTVGFGSLLYGFSEAGNKGWTNPEILMFIGVGIVFVILFGLRQLKMSDPFLDITVFKHFEFSLAAVLSGITNLAMVGIEMVLPLYIQNLRGVSAFHSGLMLLPGALMIGIMSPITGRLFDKYGARKMAITGMTLLTLGTIPFVFLTEQSSYTMIIILYAIRMVGVALVMMNVTTSGMNSLPLDKISHGTAVNNTFRQVLSSIGTAILVSVLTTTTNNNMPSKELLKTLPLQYKTQAINATLNGFHASFAMSIVFALIALVLAFFLKKGNRARENQEEVNG
ncbi:DHA2 family efflux MFS transporter permease subunit [Lactobacillus johnsonii]|uniref:DHA2 family efflux MFS transporter permease subunit n=1 Tax=Lactobacillus johnsonii TaxID=33959 RepID=A0A9X7U1E9_LACJH|nr:MDR family MFS transporter [Lactobacillus johnsonii]QLL67940.1 DHA2 family efflux MFS transporter permease subunit [Lactobacillus johnsonii]